MPWKIDARVPVRLGALAEAEPGDALLIEGETEPGPYPMAHFTAASAAGVPGCACCAPRSSAAFALNTLFQARATGRIPFFRRVLAVTASPEGDMEVWAAVRSDPLISGRFVLYEGMS